MDIIRQPSTDNHSWRRELVRRFRQGEIVMLPTDTIYGLSGRADSKEVIDRIFRIKKKDRSRPLLVLVSSLDMAARYCQISRSQRARLKEIWSGARPTTVILPHRGLLPPALTAGGEELAVRLPKSENLRKMIRSLGVPLISTSANLTGQPVLDAGQAKSAFRGSLKPDLLVSGGRNARRASRLIRLDDDGGIEVLRK